MKCLLWRSRDVDLADQRMGWNFFSISWVKNRRQEWPKCPLSPAAGCFFGPWAGRKRCTRGNKDRHVNAWQRVHFFTNEQENALEETVEASVMLRYNENQREKWSWSERVFVSQRSFYTNDTDWFGSFSIISRERVWERHCYKEDLNCPVCLCQLFVCLKCYSTLILQSKWHYKVVHLNVTQ